MIAESEVEGAKERYERQVVLCRSFSTQDRSSSQLVLQRSTRSGIKAFPASVTREKKKSTTSLIQLYNTKRDNFNYSWEWVAGGTTSLASFQCKGLKRIDRSSSRRTRHDFNFCNFSTLFIRLLTSRLFFFTESNKLIVAFILFQSRIN